MNAQAQSLIKIFKYILLISEPEKQSLIFLALFYPQRLKMSSLPNQLTTTSFIIQAICLDTTAIISVLTGIPVLFVVLIMIAQGTYLIIDAHRASSEV